jgi:hypothetical protein
MRNQVWHYLSARWIAEDALRELEGGAVQAHLRE